MRQITLCRIILFTFPFVDGTKGRLDADEGQVCRREDEGADEKVELLLGWEVDWYPVDAEREEAKSKFVWKNVLKLPSPFKSCSYDKLNN